MYTKASGKAVKKVLSRVVLTQVGSCPVPLSECFVRYELVEEDGSV
jgi:hypothetical protein